MSAHSISESQSETDPDVVARADYEELHLRYRHHKRAHIHYKELYLASRKFRLALYAFVAMTIVFGITAFVVSATSDDAVDPYYDQYLIDDDAVRGDTSDDLDW